MTKLENRNENKKDENKIKNRRNCYKTYKGNNLQKSNKFAKHNNSGIMSGTRFLQN